MFRRWLNRATVEVAISPRGPILVKSGQQSADPTRPGMEFVRTRHASLGETVYLPGTSLKGAMRSQAERVLLGLGVRVCDPFDERACGKGPRPDYSYEVYRHHCPACQTFGSLHMAGRCNIGDAYPWRQGGASDTDEVTRANATETRWQVGIDRQTGQARGGALFDLEVVVGGAFHATIHVESFSLWQLGLVATLLADMSHGDIAIGFGKTRGLGQVTATVQKLEVEMLGRDARTIAGAGSLCSPAEAKDYGLAKDDSMGLEGIAEASPTWRGRKVLLSETAATDLLDRIVRGPLAKWVEAQPKENRR